MTPLDDWIFDPDHALPLLENHFGVLSLEGFGLAGNPAAAAAAGAILHYVRSTQRGTLDHVDRIGFYERQNAWCSMRSRCGTSNWLSPCSPELIPE